MDETELQKWFFSLKKELEEAYLQHEEPWRQSGFSGPEERWTKCRKPIADCVGKSGSFLDIGCANSYLLECILNWTDERGLNIVPFGLDLSKKLIELAKDRLPKYNENFYTGNAWFWNNPIRYDYVRTEIVYVPEHLQRQYIERIIDRYLVEGGKLLVTEYRSRKDPVSKPWIDGMLREWGFDIAKQVSGYFDNKELTRVLVIAKGEGIEQ
jgi:ubiquinone/menaquinone biosynthesis C-methylase UbiE